MNGSESNCLVKNGSQLATVALDTIFKQGGFKNVYMATYTEGKRKDEKAVCKCLRIGNVFEKSYFDSELKVVDTSADIIEKFNNLKIVTATIYINQPGVWIFQEGSSKAGQYNLVEPFIPDFEKFNSNSGWTKQQGHDWHGLMQALSHYSYYISGRRLLLCDLQGGFIGGSLVLTDPVITSRFAGEYGPTDLGEKGIANFFSAHRCNKWCQSQWDVPRDKKRYFDIVEGSSMIHDGIVRSAAKPANPLLRVAALHNRNNQNILSNRKIADIAAN